MSWWPRREEAHPRRRAEGSRGGHLREVPMRQEERQVAVPSRRAVHLEVGPSLQAARPLEERPVEVPIHHLEVRRPLEERPVEVPIHLEVRRPPEELLVAVPSRLAALREEVRGHPAVAPTRVLGGCRSSPCSSPGRWLKTDGISDGWSQREARIRQQHLQLELDQNAAVGAHRDHHTPRGTEEADARLAPDGEGLGWEKALVRIRWQRLADLGFELVVDFGHTAHESYVGANGLAGGGIFPGPIGDASFGGQTGDRGAVGPGVDRVAQPSAHTHVRSDESVDAGEKPRGRQVKAAGDRVAIIRRRKTRVLEAVLGQAENLGWRLDGRCTANVVDLGDDRDVLLNAQAEPDFFALASEWLAGLARTANLVGVAVGVGVARSRRRFFFAASFLARFAGAAFAGEPRPALAVFLARRAPSFGDHCGVF